jgi:phenylalanyl-tRNA synthetase alpha chain
LLGRKGDLTALLKSLGALDPEARRAFGARVNAARDAIATAIDARRTELESAALAERLAAERIDVTLPGRGRRLGGQHPVTRVQRRMVALFRQAGFDVADGPEIETDWYNFEALNIPANHPARAMHDTFYFPEGVNEALDHAPNSRRMLLRTHTSPVQIRSMVEKGAPLRIIAPGRVYRSDSDATHTPMFHQVEGLVIDEGIHLGHLKWTLETFLKAFFERDDIVLRLRPSYFPFTEPSVEVDVGFEMVDGKRVLGGSGDASGHGWMELLGSGMVNARVIAFAGLDPDEWQGFAFGVGVDRLAMLKYGMDDLRAFFDGNVRWLKHYGFSAFDQPTLSAGVGARP